MLHTMHLCAAQVETDDQNHKQGNCYALQNGSTMPSIQKLFYSSSECTQKPSIFFAVKYNFILLLTCMNFP